MGYILNELNHVRKYLGEYKDKEELKKKIKNYIKEYILPQIQIIDNGYDYELHFPFYRLWELMFYEEFKDAIKEIEININNEFLKQEEEIAFHYLKLILSNWSKYYWSPK